MGKPPRPRPSPNKSPKLAIPAPSPAGAPSHSKRGVTSSNSSTGSAPSSVMCVPASQLTRELSDLSGSYMNGNTAPRSGHHLNRSFGNSVCSEEPVQGFWRQAYLLSTPCRREPAPAASPHNTSGSTAASALIVVERNGVIELVKKSDAGSASGEEDDAKKASSQHDKNNTNDSQSSESAEVDLMFLAHNSQASLHLPANQSPNDNDESSSRMPILILLMDPGRKLYELMQLWVDPSTDLVRDVLLALQRKLSDKWRQDYDGLFQLRGNEYCQLVHILSIAKYDIRPRELWVAKPWSMAAKSTIELANDCVRQLRAGGLLSVYASNSPGKSRIKNFLRSGRNSPPVPDEDGPLTLSDEALKRMHIPNGVMKHHHACQFISFRAPAIPSRVLGQTLGAHNSQQKGFLGSLLGTSQSFDDVSSQLSNPSDVYLLPFTAESPSKLNSSNSTASPSSRARQRHHHQQGYSRQHRHGLPVPTNLDSKWHPSGPLEVVGEVIMSSSAKDAGTGANPNETEEAANVSTILADLETSNNFPELKQKQEEEVDLSQPEPPTTNKKEQRCSLWKALFAPLNCAKRRSLAGGSRKGDDGYCSSRDGSSGAKSSSKNSNENHDNDGRETPTSKGSNDADDANEDAFAWHRAGEDHSIVSDSVPLLSMPETSSACGSVTNQVQPEQVQPEQSQINAQTIAVANASPFSRFYNITDRF